MLLNLKNTKQVCVTLLCDSKKEIHEGFLSALSPSLKRQLLEDTTLSSGSVLNKVRPINCSEYWSKLFLSIMQ